MFDINPQFIPGYIINYHLMANFLKDSAPSSVTAMLMLAQE